MSGREQLRDKRRTSRVIIGPDTVRLCEPECRNEVLLDLGVPISGGQYKYRPHGEVTAHVEWNHTDYHVTWDRRPYSSLPCDLCADEWQYRIPGAVAAARRSAEAQKGRTPAHGTPFSQKSGVFSPEPRSGTP
jgi:hypothetical protein